MKCSVMFGRGKFQNGVLIEPTEDYVFDPKDTAKLEAFRNKIWCVMYQFSHLGHLLTNITPDRPTIERVNEYAPQHSRIFKEVSIFYKNVCSGFSEFCFR